MRNATCSAILAPLAASLLAPAPARADVAITSQHRQVVTFASVVVDGEFSVDSDVFNADSTGHVELQDTGDAAIGESTAHAEAWQSSVIDISSIILTGATGATAAVDPAAPDAFAEANGATSLSVHFDVSSSTEYVLGGGLSAGGAGNVTLALTSQGAGPIWSLSPPADGTLPLSEFGVLAPDGYVLTFSSGGYAQAGFGGAIPFQSGAFDVAFDLLGVVAVFDDAPIAGGGFSIAPNPARYGAPVRIDVGDSRGEVTISILDVSGRLLSRLTPADGRTTWDGTDAHGRPAAPGVYFVRLDGTQTTSRVTVLR